MNSIFRDLSLILDVTGSPYTNKDETVIFSTFYDAS